MIIAIDGPSGCGKTSTAKLLSEKLEINYCDSGILYRSITYFLIKKEVDLEDYDSISAEIVNLRVKYDILNNRIFINNQDITRSVRLPEVTRAVSKVSSMKIVRNKLIDIQRDLINSGDIIVDGRDIGTTVFPNADYKFYLDATLDVRTKRRVKQLKEKKIKTDYRTVFEMIKKRDELDRSRVHSPLSKAADAMFIDTTNLTLQDQVNKIISIIEGPNNKR